MTTAANQFADRLGRVWTLEFDVTLARRIRKALQLDFANVHDGKALQTINADDEQLVNVLWLLCEDQARAQQVGEEEFGRGLGGDALGRALDALQEAVILFCRPDKRPAIEAILRKTRAVTARAVDVTVARIESEQTDRLIDQQMETLSDTIDRRMAEAASPPTAGRLSSTARRS